MRLVNRQRSRRAIAWTLVTCLLLGAFLWVRSSSNRPVLAVAALIDPEKLSTLRSKRAANPRLLKCVYWLHVARARGRAPETIIAEAQAAAHSTGAHAELVKQSLLRNLDIAEKLGCLTPENIERLRRGSSPTITRGPYAGETAEVDHIVPVSVVPELDKEIANLELMPATLNRRKGARMGERQLDYLRRFAAAGVLSQKVAERIRRNVQPRDDDDR